MTRTFTSFKQPELTRERFREFFCHCAGCGIVLDKRSGKYLSEPDALELEELLRDFRPAILQGPECPWCINHNEQMARLRRKENR